MGGLGDVGTVTAIVLNAVLVFLAVGIFKIGMSVVVYGSARMAPPVVDQPIDSLLGWPDHENSCNQKTISVKTDIHDKTKSSLA